MQSNEVRKQTGLTRKAIEYYEVQGLVEPSRDENGYRNYSDSDVRILKRINLYRQLGLDLSEIRKIVGVENKKEVLASIVRDKSIRLELDWKPRQRRATGAELKSQWRAKREPPAALFGSH